MPTTTQAPRPSGWRAAIVGAVCAGLVLVSTGCVGRKGNNDGPKRPGEPNPAQPYADERRALESDSQRSDG